MEDENDLNSYRKKMILEEPLTWCGVERGCVPTREVRTVKPKDINLKIHEEYIK